MIPPPEDYKGNDFFVQFFRKTGNSYVLSSEHDKSVIVEGPPDNYTWEVVRGTMGVRDHYTFKRKVPLI